MSTYDLLGFPTQVSLLLLTLALVLALVPYLGGSDVGPLKVPTLDPRATRRLRRWGWMLPLVAAVMYLPAWPAPADDGGIPGSFAIEVAFVGGNRAALTCQELTGASAVLRVSDRSYRAPIDARCTATFLDLPGIHENQEATLGIAEAPDFLVQESGTRTLVRGTTLTATLDDRRILPRLRIAILPTSVDAAAPHFQQFQEALADKILNVSQTFAGRGDAYAYLNRLKISNDGPHTPSMEEMANFWRDSHALELVRGQVAPASSELIVHSSVFLGGLEPDPTRARVDFAVEVSPDEFERTHNSFSVVTLYALALDAQRLQRPPDVIVSLLSEALSIATQIEDPPAQLLDVRRAIESRLTEIRDLAGQP